MHKLNPDFINLLGKRLYISKFGYDRLIQNNLISYYGDYERKTYKEESKEKIKCLVSGREKFTEDYSTAEIGSIATYLIDGVITSSGSWMFSTEDFVRDLQTADSNPNISGHFIIINSPGGDSYGLNTAFNVIRNLTKPTLVYAKEILCSAAYYLASGASKILSANKFDTIGSIGTMCVVVDIRGLLEKWGVKEIEIYATDSVEKNKYYRDILDDKKDNFIKDCIDPIQAEFSANVQAARPLTIDYKDEGIYAGKTFYAPKAQELGMIDGIATMDEAMETIVFMSEDYDKTKNLQQTILNNL